MRVMEYIREHREDENPFECVILPDGSVDAPVPSHIEKLAQIAGEDKISLNKKMEKNMEPLFSWWSIRDVCSSGKQGW